MKPNPKIRELIMSMGINPEDEHYDVANAVIQECLDICKNIRDEAKAQKDGGFLTDSGKMLYEGVYGGANNCGFAIQNRFADTEPQEQAGWCPGCNPENCQGCGPAAKGE